MDTKLIDFYLNQIVEATFNLKDIFKKIEFNRRSIQVVDFDKSMQKSALHFSHKEIMQMPIQFQKIISINVEIHVRQRGNGVFEARFRKNGYDIIVSSKDYDLLKPKFLAALKTAQQKSKQKTTNKKSFREVAELWLELKKPTIKSSSFTYYTSLFGANIFPVIGDQILADVKQSDLQSILNTYIDVGKFRTATKIYQTLKAVFDFAVGDDLIEKSPMQHIRAPKYEEKNGCALTIAEEREFLKKLAESNCSDIVAKALIFLLYTGIRRSELSSARVDDGFVSVICSKTRKGFQEKRRLIPITPMLRRQFPVLNINEFRDVHPNALTQAMKRLMPAHHLHELRHTFITRCQECAVPREVVSVWAGHAPDTTMTSNVYTHFSREFMAKEAEKIRYNL